MLHLFTNKLVIFRPKYTIIFVAFDLEEVGSQGSLIFIKEYLMKVLHSQFPKEVVMAKFQVITSPIKARCNTRTVA